MKKLLLSLVITMPLFINGTIILDEIDGLKDNMEETSESLMQQHILNLCRSEIIPISSTQCATAAIRATLAKKRRESLQRKEKGRQMGWDRERIDEEGKLLLAEFDKVRRKK